MIIGLHVHLKLLNEVNLILDHFEYFFLLSKRRATRKPLCMNNAIHTHRTHTPPPHTPNTTLSLEAKYMAII